MPWIDRFRDPPPVVNVLRLSGVIGGDGRRNLNLTSLAGGIRRAFASKKVKAVALLINSPGGSPVQSAQIGRRIRDLAEEKEKPVYAFVEDVAASGGYWLACAADEIYADDSSIVGSVGVIFAGFGFQDLIARYGVERRVYTAGKRKSVLDPFQAERSEDVTRIKEIGGDIHEVFKSWVSGRRGARLRAEDEDLYEGDFWAGRRALDLGLIDGLGHIRPILREKFGPRVRLRLVNPERSFLRSRLRFGTAEPRDWVTAVATVAQERALWSRYGL